MFREGLGGGKERELWKYSKEELKAKRDAEANKTKKLDENDNEILKRRKIEIEAELSLGNTGKEAIAPKENMEKDMEIVFKNATELAELFAEFKKEKAANA